MGVGNEGLCVQEAEYANGRDHSLTARSGENSGRTKITVEAAVIASSRARTAIDARRVQARQMIGLSQVKTAEIATSPFDARMTNSCGS
jgi:uncharacterized protein (DUF427 family)